MLFRIVNKFHQEVFSDPDVPNGLNRSIDFRAVTLEHDRLLTTYRQEWAERFKQDSDHSGARDPPLSISASLTFAICFPGVGTDAACEFRVKLLPLYVDGAFSGILILCLAGAHLFFFCVTAMRITRGSSCSHLGSKRHSSAASKPTTRYSSRG
jgi:hypothetical protein